MPRYAAIGATPGVPGDRAVSLRLRPVRAGDRVLAGGDPRSGGNRICAAVGCRGRGSGSRGPTCGRLSSTTAARRWAAPSAPSRSLSGACIGTPATHRRVSHNPLPSP